jgi:hemolysin III
MDVHYPSAGARVADLAVHIAGLALGGAGGIVLIGLSLHIGGGGLVAAVSVYAVCLLAMFAFSTAYNFARPSWQPLLRRFDHAAIFLMIAGSYTPFTTQRLEGTWAIGMTLAVWTLALAGAAAKLLAPGLDRRFWVGLYLALGWAVLVAIKPLAGAVSVVALILLVAGGLLYSSGVLVYARERLPFRRAIWHGFVLAAAAVQYAAVLVGVVLATPH